MKTKGDYFIDSGSMAAQSLPAIKDWRHPYLVLVLFLSLFTLNAYMEHLPLPLTKGDVSAQDIIDSLFLPHASKPTSD
ncbi:MAG: hypothetical protein MI864_01900 [Pseudomonadales bacterium]|nr:hypothetical protein [Pseudomonadales bacterium]